MTGVVMTDRIVKVGLKGKYMKIPEGWYRVTEGACKKWDKFADLSCFCFRYVEDDDLDMPADTFDCLIRENDSPRTKGGVG